MTDSFALTFAAVTAIKEALISEWNETQHFVDKNNMTKPGVIPEMTGLTGLLLLLITFWEEERVITPEDRQVISGIIRTSMDYAYGEIEKSGYNAEPYIDKSKSAELFKDGCGYIDTVTWVFSAGMLARYAQQIGAAEMDPETQGKVFHLIAQSLQLVLKGQREDGTWGFMSDPKAQRSLYFTYTACAAIGDFYYYVLGEIKEVEQRNDRNAISGDDYRDDELIAYLNKETKGDVVTRLATARRKLQDWLLRDCLPLMPKVAACRDMNAKELSKLGMWKHDMDGIIDTSINYFNLYYAYYLIEMMIASAANVRYNGFNAQDIEALGTSYSNDNALSTTDWVYYFNKEGSDPKRLLLDYIEQTVHASRANYLIASRTGAAFWDAPGGGSELTIQWVHDDQVMNMNIARVKGKKDIITDPSLIPLAMRANAVYGYYISTQRSNTLDSLMQAILANRSAETQSDRVENLWDTISYNLAITERAIEAIVDYYDYLCKFAQSAPEEIQAVPQDAAPPGYTKSALDEAVERKIAEYLSSDTGMKLLRKANEPSVAAPAALPVQGTHSIDYLAEQLTPSLNIIKKWVAGTAVPKKESAEAEDRFIHLLVSTVNEINKCRLREIFAGGLIKDGQITEYSALENEAMERGAKFDKEYEELLQKVSAYLDETKGTMKKLYEKLRAIDNRPR